MKQLTFSEDRSGAKSASARQEVSESNHKSGFDQQLRSQSQVQLQQQSVIGNGLIQRKTFIENQGQWCRYGANGDKRVVVGYKMDAWLDPNDQIQGQSYSVNSSQDGLMQWIKGVYPMAKGVFSVKGHLLNDNLGGTALDNNLYPISKGANGMHLSSAENFVKNKIFKAGKPVKYSVTVDGANDYSGANDQNATARFRTSVSQWNDVTNKGSVGDVMYTANITSDLGRPKLRTAFDANDNQLPNISATGANPNSKPKKLVGHLTSNEKKLRFAQPGALAFDSDGNINAGEATTGSHTDDSYTYQKAIALLQEDPASFVSEYITDEVRELINELDSSDLGEMHADIAIRGIFDKFLEGIPSDFLEAIESEMGPLDEAMAIYLHQEFAG